MKRGDAAGPLAGATLHAFAIILPPPPVARNDLFELTGLGLFGVSGAARRRLG